MVWAFESPDFEYDDWAPYAVYEDSDVLVVRSEGDYFFALRVDDIGDRWHPLPMESDNPEDLERLRSVTDDLLDAAANYRRQLQRLGLTGEEVSSGANGWPAGGDDWRRVDDYDTLWGRLQQLVPTVMRLKGRLSGDPRES